MKNKMDKQDFQTYITNAKKDMGWKWYWYGFTGWISDHTILIQDVWWWMTDGVAYWDDVVACDRKLCAHCGNKPFNK
jgi:hypothetical protein